MLNSKSPRHPNGIANSSGVLGHYLMDHIMGGGASGVLPVLKGIADPRGNRPNGVYIAR
jgi:glucoside 3-dehydrogenase (cytochrome c) catalytic subunit